MTRTRPRTRPRRSSATTITRLPLADRASGRRDGDDVRWSRVMTAQARITVGYYRRSDVQDLVVTAVLNELRRR
jgi:hypothetical protein